MGKIATPERSIYNINIPLYGQEKEPERTDGKTDARDQGGQDQDAKTDGRTELFQPPVLIHGKIKKSAILRAESADLPLDK